MVETWIADAEGRRWCAGPAQQRVDQRLADAAEQAVLTQPVLVRVNLDLFCAIEPGQALPDMGRILERVMHAIVLGGDQGRRPLPPIAPGQEIIPPLQPKALRVGGGKQTRSTKRRRAAHSVGAA